MQLAKVIGNVVATEKVASLVGVKLLIVQKVNENGQELGDPFVAVDATEQAGEGELVLIESGREAAVALPDWYNPADQGIVAIVDSVYSVEQTQLPPQQVPAQTEMVPVQAKSGSGKKRAKD